MSTLHSYAPEDIVLSNLRELSARASSRAEQTLAHLRELAREIAGEVDPTPELLASLPDHRLIRQRIGADCLPQNADAVNAKDEQEHAWNSIFLCKELERVLSERAPLTPDLFFPEFEELPEATVNRIVYQRSSYTDEAYLRFAGLLTLPRATYAKSFDAACESVYKRECEYCILPLETSDAGQLTGFWRLIARYGLKLAAVCDLPTSNQNQITRFALLRATPTVLTVKTKNDRYFACALQGASAQGISNLLYAAGCCGITPIQIHSEDVFSSDCESPTLRFVFRTNGGDLNTFLLYLLLEQPTHTPLGYYPYL